MFDYSSTFLLRLWFRQPLDESLGSDALRPCAASDIADAYSAFSVIPGAYLDRNVLFRSLQMNLHFEVLIVNSLNRPECPAVIVFLVLEVLVFAVLLKQFLLQDHVTEVRLCVRGHQSGASRLVELKSKIGLCSEHAIYRLIDFAFISRGFEWCRNEEE